MHGMDTLHAHLARLRPELLRAARNRLRNASWAEDEVSETMLAALQHPPPACDERRLRSWLHGVLRHKLVDQLRLQLGQDGGALVHDMIDFESEGLGDPSPQADPALRAGERQFIRALHAELQRLPRAQAEAFWMRECLGRTAHEICEELAVSSNNLWVMLHRARHRLRQRLAAHA